MTNKGKRLAGRELHLNSIDAFVSLPVELNYGNAIDARVKQNVSSVLLVNTW